MVRPKGYPASQKLSYVDIERSAMRARTIMFPEAEINDSVSGVELFDGIARFSLTHNGSQLPLDSAVSETLRGEGMSEFDREEGQIVVSLSETVYENLEEGDARAKFTLCHELGHVLLHGDVLISLSGIPHDQAAMFRGRHASHDWCQDTEWQADAFAGALLMPVRGLAALLKAAGGTATDLKSPWFIQHVSNTFGVSFQAAMTRTDKVSGRWEMLLACR